MANKYGNLLTIILVVLVVAILAGTGIIIYNYAIKPNSDKNKAMQAISEFDMNIQTDNNEEETGEADTNVSGPTETESGSSGERQKSYYNGFVMVGYITIPATNVKLPVLDQETPKSLDVAVAVRYPSNAKLNEPGNVVIAGHNYRDGRFFANNKKLAVGDKLSIKDTSGKELTYTIYEKFQTTTEDTSFYNRNTNGAIEVTLTTCTDDAKARIIILARADS